MGKGMGGYQSQRMLTDVWLTPRHIIDALGPFDLDPCAPAVQPWPTGEKRYTNQDDGLAQEWAGHVWLNPPYGKEARKWLARLADHGDGLALIFARTETEMFFSTVWDRATAVLFLRGRLTFCRVDGTPAKANGGAPSVLIAYGSWAASRLESVKRWGKLIRLREVP